MPPVVSRSVAAVGAWFYPLHRSILCHSFSGSVTSLLRKPSGWGGAVMSDQTVSGQQTRSGPIAYAASCVGRQQPCTVANSQVVCMSATCCSLVTLRLTWWTEGTWEAVCSQESRTGMLMKLPAAQWCWPGVLDLVMPCQAGLEWSELGPGSCPRALYPAPGWSSVYKVLSCCTVASERLPATWT
jgi:hypothetical protein